jgi:polysaccharide biosynthesis/export protein
MKKTPSSLRFSLFLYLLLFSVIISGCRSNKHLSFLRDAKAVMPGAPVQKMEYRIQTNDNLYISIITPNQEMNEIYNPATVGNMRAINNIWQTLPGQLVQGIMVEHDGVVTLPIVGKVSVVGKTMREAETVIQDKAREYLKEVTAKVRVINYKITVMGEVESPGVYFNYNYEFTVMDAISSASGIKNAADLKNVLVLRQTSNGSKSFRLDLNSSKGLSSEGYFLQPNDVVVIQPSRYKNVELRLPIYTVGLSTITTFLLVLNYISNN